MALEGDCAPALLPTMVPLQTESNTENAMSNETSGERLLTLTCKTPSGLAKLIAAARSPGETSARRSFGKPYAAQG